MINEASIKCFMALCETLSFTEAARQLFMTQQSVSKYIAKLEEDRSSSWTRVRWQASAPTRSSWNPARYIRKSYLAS